MSEKLNNSKNRSPRKNFIVRTIFFIWNAEQLFTAVLYRLKLITGCSLRNELNHFIQE